jgi:hypothetical protein
MSATNRFRANLLGALTALIIQFLLGMGVNLFVTITRRHPGANASNFFGGVIQTVFWAATQAPIVLILHTILGLFILLNAIGVVVNAVRLRASGTLGPAIIGLIGVLAAGFNGASFLIYNHDINSYLMSVGFAIATGAYVWLLYMLPRVEAAAT